jgi:hypothetical protein
MKKKKKKKEKERKIGIAHPPFPPHQPTKSKNQINKKAIKELCGGGHRTLSPSRSPLAVPRCSSCRDMKPSNE